MSDHRKGLRLHDLRASCISLLVEDNYSIKDIQDWVGQKDIETTLKFMQG